MLLSMLDVVPQTELTNDVTKAVYKSTVSSVYTEPRKKEGRLENVQYPQKYLTYYGVTTKAECNLSR